MRNLLVEWPAVNGQLAKPERPGLESVFELRAPRRPGNGIHDVGDFDGCYLLGGFAKLDLIEWRLGLIDGVAELPAQLRGIGDNFPHFGMRSLAAHAFVHDRNLEALRQFARHPAELGEPRVRILQEAKVHRRVAHRPAEGAVDEARPWSGAK